MSNLSQHAGSVWKGHAELWLDPLGDSAATSECMMAVEADRVTYTWSHDGTSHTGSIALGTDGGADFTDTFHSPEVMPCAAVTDGWGLLQVFGTYGPDRDWGWRLGISYRQPTGELVLQMTNVAPWGEEARAVRMICSPAAPGSVAAGG